VRFLSVVVVVAGVLFLVGGEIRLWTDARVAAQYTHYKVPSSGDAAKGERSSVRTSVRGVLRRLSVRPGQG